MMEEKKIFKFETKINGEKLELEIGKMAEMADAAVTAKLGDTMVLATVVCTDEPKEGCDFFPMLVDYEERWYASGKISGSRFVKRETRPSEEAVLTARLIDRCLRPLFPKDYRNDVQIIVTVLSADLEHSPDIPAIIASSTALMLSKAPFAGPVGACRVGLISDKIVQNPTTSDLIKSDLDLVFAGTRDAVLMIEAGANEVSEEKVLESFEFSQKAIQDIIKLQDDIVKKLGKGDEKHQIEHGQEEMHDAIKKYLGKKLAKIVEEMDKAKRQESMFSFEQDTLKNFEGKYKQNEIQTAFKTLVEKEIRLAILDKSIRPDGRKVDEIRPINLEVGLLPRTHGSALFSRGQTQVLSVTTLAAPSAEQIVQTMEEEAKKRYMHHYIFPPFSVGEAQPIRSASRREIGHGALAERALIPVLPSQDEFPYTIRVVSDVLSSNGSTSMASVCGSTLSLMDAGVPIQNPVAGISIGLVQSDKKYVTLVDIQGIEDFAGDMDFKVAGTKNGITAIQLDVKTIKLTNKILAEAIEKARKARFQILEKINKLMPQSRENTSEFAPKVVVTHIDQDKIRDLVGPGGRIINGIIAKTSASIDIDPDGKVTVSADTKENLDIALEMIGQITKVAKPGEIYSGKVTRIMDFGAFVEILPGKEGLVHISQLASHHVNKVSDIVKVGDIIKVKVTEIDDLNRINLSKKAVDQK
jgi:polyribonucleotide nucleotidyltransferase